MAFHSFQQGGTSPLNSPQPPQQNPGTPSLNDIANLLNRLTGEHYAKKDWQPFFRLMHQLALRGMGVGNNGNVDQSGELVVMAQIRDTLARRYPIQSLTIFDVGANVGQFIAAAVQVFGTQDRRYYSFEPSPQAFLQLQSAVNQLNAGPAISVHNFGLGNSEEKVPLYSNTAGAEIGSLYQRKLDHIGIKMDQVEEVTIRTIDNFAAEEKIERIHFLKIDTEGHELKCIEGARRLIDAGRIDFIQFEMGCNIDARTFLRDFWDALPNYRIARILRDGLFEFERYNEMDEQIGTQNFVATLRT